MVSLDRVIAYYCDTGLLERFWLVVPDQSRE